MKLMILKKLLIQNFRSYGETPTTVEFDRGLLLFEGEIGSGKSSILYAIEFALFGLGELESKFLIRGSAETARVELDFDVAGQEYKVTRTISRRRKNVQTRGWILEPDGKETEYPPTELRSRTLQILNFREKQGSKSSSRIYRYAIFTPQELMKEVLTQSSEERIDTLRRAFGVEDYSFAGSNTELVLRRLNELRKMYSKLSEGLGEKENLILETRESLSAKEKELERTRSELLDLDEKIMEEKSRLSSLELESKKVTQLQALIPELTKTLSSLQMQISESQEEMERQGRARREIENAELTISSLREQFEKYESNKDNLRELGNLQSERLSIETQISGLEASISAEEKNLDAKIRSLEKDSQELQEKISSYFREESTLASLQQDAEALRRDIENLPRVHSKISELSSEIGATTAILNSKQSEALEIGEKMGRIGGLEGETNCPLCGQKLTPDHMGKVREEYTRSINTIELKIREAAGRLALFQENAKELESQRVAYLASQERLEEIESRISLARENSKLASDLRMRLDRIAFEKENLHLKLKQKEFALDEQRKLAELLLRRGSLLKPLSDLAKLEENVRQFEESGGPRSFQSAEIAVSKKWEVDRLISLLANRIGSLEQDVTRSGAELEEKKKELEESEPAMFRYAKTKEELDLLSGQRSDIVTNIAVLSSEIESRKKDVQRLEEEVRKLKEGQSKALLYGGVSSWLDERFLPAVREIESYVFSSINEEFNVLLQRFFSILVEEGEFTATVDDAFTPIVEQAGYELDVQSLSGGERTAIALAYRLALNYMVKQANDAMHASLLILDEPTEGFSKEQIYKLRNVIEELNCDQVIIVSHESDLETMADRVYRVEKIGGESRVILAS